jgi:ProP effector
MAQNRIAKAIRAELVARFPDAIVPKRGAKKPLVLGIKRELQHALPDRSPSDIREFLRDYCSGRSYLEALSVPGAARVGLDGFPSGVVTHEAAAVAANHLREMNARAAAVQRLRDARSQSQPATMGAA